MERRLTGIVTYAPPGSKEIRVFVEEEFLCVREQ
jgi:hypothetical protein